MVRVYYGNTGVLRSAEGGRVIRVYEFLGSKDEIKDTRSKNQLDRDLLEILDKH